MTKSPLPKAVRDSALVFQLPGNSFPTEKDFSNTCAGLLAWDHPTNSLLPRPRGAQWQCSANRSLESVRPSYSSGGTAADLHRIPFSCIKEMQRRYFEQYFEQFTINFSFKYAYNWKCIFLFLFCADLLWVGLFFMQKSKNLSERKLIFSL